MFVENIQLEGVGNPTLKAYIQEPSEEMPVYAKRPSILVIPGGGYHFCSDREADPIAMAFMAQGYSAFVLRYSINEAAQWPNPLRDAESALKLIRDRAEEWGLMPDKIAAIGFSAGGHLAAALGTLGEVRPNAMILGYPCILAEEECLQEFNAPNLEDKVTKETPPTFIFAASDDGRVPIRHSLRFADALDVAGIPFQLHIFDQGNHGFSLATKEVSNSKYAVELYKEPKRWLKMCVDWLDRIFEVGPKE